MGKIKAKAVWLGNVRSVVDNQRTQSIVCDMGIPVGGTDTGPTALELSMMSLADCGLTIFADVCKKSNIQLSKIEVTVEAEKAADGPTVSGVTMKVSVVSNARKELVEAAWRRTEANCPVVLIFKNQTPVTVELESKTE
jgi:uncharacterized OsmC-like protein